MIQIKVTENHLYVIDEHRDVYMFEHFANNGELYSVIAVSAYDDAKEVKDFIRQNHAIVHKAEMASLFDKRKHKYDVMFVECGGSFSYLVLLKPGKLTIKQK